MPAQMYRFFNVVVRSLFMSAALVLSVVLAPLGAQDASDPKPATGHVNEDISQLIERAQQRARAMDLAGALYWRSLVHYAGPPEQPEQWWSRIDDTAFFLAPNGATDSEAELLATVSALFRPHTNEAPNAVERYPARAAWLIEQLDIDLATLPQQQSSEVAQVLKEFQPRRVSLVFPDAYLSSPASAFGHSLLAMQGANENPLNDLAINYAAITGDSGGVGYIARGITGGFRGQYSYMPYHQKMTQYAHGDMRDQWVYQLDLNDAEIKRMVMHLLELTEIGADYYFFDENCAFNILYLVEIARPGLQLIDATRPWVIPLDTIRMIDQHGLIVTAEWRPSTVTEIRLRAAELTPEDGAFVRKIARGELPVTTITDSERSAKQQAELFDLLAKYLFAMRNREEIDLATYQKRLLPMLRARAKVAYAESTMPELRPSPSPETGHGTSRLQAGMGTVDQRFFAQIGWRPAYHDLEDPLGGYPRSGIQFLNTSLRWYDEGDHPEIHEIDFVRVRALPLRDAWFQPWSWTAGLALKNEPVLPDEQRRLDLVGNAGGGMSWGTDDFLLSLLADGEARTTEGGSHHAVGFGGSLDGLWQVNDVVAFRPRVRVIENILGEETTDFMCDGTAVFGAGTQWALQVTIGYRHAWALDGLQTQATASWYW
jgi:hypothetical protein